MPAAAAAGRGAIGRGGGCCGIGRRCRPGGEAEPPAPGRHRVEADQVDPGPRVGGVGVELAGDEELAGAVPPEESVAVGAVLPERVGDHVRAAVVIAPGAAKRVRCLGSEREGEEEREEEGLDGYPRHPKYRRPQQNGQYPGEWGRLQGHLKPDISSL